MNHKIVINLLKNKIKDKGFLQLIKAMLKAGYLENWKFHNTYSGTPQGGIISPILSNIYLHELDTYMIKLGKEYTTGKRGWFIEQRRYRLRKKINETETKTELVKEYKKMGDEMREIPSQVVTGDDYKRLKYCRYADDFISATRGCTR